MDPTSTSFNVILLDADERWELYRQAESMGLLTDLPTSTRPQPIRPPLEHMKFEHLSKVLWCIMQSNNPDLSEDERLAAIYAFHVWRERVDVWEYAPVHNHYDTFVSVYELERYIVNPWLRASSWVASPAVNLMDLPQLPKFDTMSVGLKPLKKKNTDVNRTALKFQYCVNQVPNWWARQKETQRFKPVPELTLTCSGFVSAAQLLEPPSEIHKSFRVDRNRLVEKYWHNAMNDPQVEALQRTCFTWQEFIDRRDELSNMIPSVIGQLSSMGSLGSSYGSGIRDRRGVSLTQNWTGEKKMLNRLATKVKTLSRYADAIAEVALLKMGPQR
jgi:hypothetical protein